MKLQYRKNDKGEYTHDGDCHIWESYSICTCGLLHKLLPFYDDVIKAEEYPDFHDHWAKQDAVLDTLRMLNHIMAGKDA